MLLKLALWQDVHEYLERRSDVVIPFGGTEQHGPSGPLGTDLIIAEELATQEALAPLGRRDGRQQPGADHAAMRIADAAHRPDQRAD